MKFCPILTLIFIVKNPIINGEVKLNLRKIECNCDKELVEVKECFLKNDSLAFGLHFRIEFIKQIEKLTVNGGVSYKYSDTHRPFLKYHYNLCKKPNIRSKFETSIFNVIYNGFHAKIGTLCPIKVGHVYFAKSDGNKDFDPAQIPQIVPTGDFSILLNYLDGKNNSVFGIRLYVTIRKT